MYSAPDSDIYGRKKKQNSTIEGARRRPFNF